MALLSTDTPWMDLQHALRSIRSIPDLPPLITCLGHRSAWEAVPADAWTERPGTAGPLTLVGLTGKVPWFAVESPTPERTAVLLARRISRRGKLAILLALDARRRRLGVAVAFDRSPALEFSLDNPDPEALASIARLGGAPDHGSLAFGARAADALSSEPVGRRFFRHFKATLDRMAGALPGPMPTADRHALVLLQLTRVLFLYFIQSKGWLAGRDQFLAQEVDACLLRRRRIHRDFLRPLFFGTLNQPPASRGRTASRFGGIPFLNGGLFEPHPLERKYSGDIPNPLWREAFDTLFQRFHFTVAEGTGRGSVAPDMLGRVFEGVMAPDERRASGTFYTPAALVDRVVEAALVVHLSVRLHCPEGEAQRRLADRDPGLAQVLGSITVLDPAVGSGAFLLVALERLAALRGQHTLAAHKRGILQQNLFGVDQNAAAVRLTELRLWLSVIAADRAESPSDIHPLPNLDCLIRQGDSLLDPVGLGAGAGLPNTALAADVSNLRKDVICASGPDKHRLARRLRQLEIRALRSSLDVAEQRTREIIAAYLQQARAPDLFGHRRGLDRELRSYLREARLSLRGLRHAQRRLTREGEVTWFHYQSAFPDVFARGGFDIVLGNPPWLRSEVIPSTTRKQLSARYRWWRGQGRTYGNSPDLSVAFLERALELAVPNGVVAMLVPLKIASAGYGTGARHGLAGAHTLHVLADLTGRDEATFDATVYPLALIARKSPPASSHCVRTGLSGIGSSTVRQSALQGGGPWVLRHSKGITEVLNGLEQDHPPLAGVLTCHLGVKTGLNRVFLNPPDEIEPQVLRWAIRGRDVKAFCCQPRIRLLWTHDSRGNPLSELPPRARAYLHQHEAALRGRRDYQGGPPWSVFRTRAASARYRVVWSDLGRQLTAAALCERSDLDRIPLNTCYLGSVSTAAQARALSAWLNSTWIRACAAAVAVPASGGFSRFNARVVNRLPLPPAALVDPALAELANAAGGRKPPIAELDAVVGRHLGLSRSAERALRAVVGKSFLDHR